MPNYNSGILEIRWQNRSDFLQDHSLYTEFQNSQRFIMRLLLKIKKIENKKEEIINKSNKHNIVGGD